MWQLEDFVCNYNAIWRARYAPWQQQQHKFINWQDTTNE